MDIRTLMAARLYVRDTALGLGAVKGSPCTITSITEKTDGIHIVFSWTGTDGTVATQTAIMPYVAVDKVAREAVETLRDDMNAAIDTTVRTVNGKKPDGKGNVAIPLGVTGAPVTGSPNQVFVTDGEGNPLWDDRRHWLELMEICPDLLTDPDVKIYYDPAKTEIGEEEFRDNNDIEVAYFPNVKVIRKNAFLDSKIKVAIFPNVETAYNTCFKDCTVLETVYMPKLVTNYMGVFHGCTALTDVSFPAWEVLAKGAEFQSCSNLVSMHLPKVKDISNYSMQSCTALEIVDFPCLEKLNGRSFQNTALTTLILRTNKVCTLTNAFKTCPIASGTGYIYVPAALIEDYKVAANWSTYAAQFRAIEDYPEICDPTMDEPITKGEAIALVNDKMAGGGGSGGGWDAVIKFENGEYGDTANATNFTKDNLVLYGKTFAELKAMVDAGEMPKIAVSCSYEYDGNDHLISTVDCVDNSWYNETPALSFYCWWIDPNGRRLRIILQESGFAALIVSKVTMTEM